MKIIFSSVLFFFFISTSLLSQQAPTELARNFKTTELYAWKMKGVVAIPTASKGAVTLISMQPIVAHGLVNHTEYIKGMTVGNAKVLEIMDVGQNDIVIKGLMANTKYYLAFVVFNSNATNDSFYYASNFLTVDFTTAQNNYGSYYNGLSTADPQFLTKLTERLQFQLPLNHYSNFFNTLVPEFYQQDTFDNGSKYYVNCEYSNKKALYTGGFAFFNSNFSREHILAKNWMNFAGVANNSMLHDMLEGADWHNLALTDATVNGRRGTLVLDTAIQNVEFLGNAKIGRNNLDSFCFEPQANFKGNAARAIFYQMLKHNGSRNANWGLDNLLNGGNMQKQSILKQWAKQDPVDNFEYARHEAIAAFQKNRNPFIDFPEWIDCIDFQKITQVSVCKEIPSTLSLLGQKGNWDILLYQNSDALYAKLFFNQPEQIRIEAFDLIGNKILEQFEKIGSGQQEIKINANLTNGIYIFRIQSAQNQFIAKYLIN